MDPMRELIVAVNRFREDPSKKEESLRKIAELLGNGDEEFLKRAKNLLSGNGKGRNNKDEFW